jgi:glycosyltransferase involved in cell wall biosynthesis
MLRFFQHAVVLTRIEKDHALCLNKNIEITEIPLAVDTNEYMPENGSVEYPSIAFSGTMSYPPNQEAVLFFLKHIFPDIVLRFPKIRFYVAGRNPSNEIMALSIDNVIVTGEVQDISQYISRCSVFVVPLLNGGGMRFKILEAFSLAKPVVSTPIGAQGINYTDGEDILIASHPASFAERVCDLLGDPAKARRQGETARRLVQKNYSLEVVLDKWARLYKHLLTMGPNESPAACCGLFAKDGAGTPHRSRR